MDWELTRRTGLPLVEQTATTGPCNQGIFMSSPTEVIFLFVFLSRFLLVVVSARRLRYLSRISGPFYKSKIPLFSATKILQDASAIHLVLLMSAGAVFTCFPEMLLVFTLGWDLL